MTKFRSSCGSVVLGLAILALGLATTASAQSTTGSIRGVVNDEQVAVVPGAAVTVRNVDTNMTRTAVTDSGGRFRVTNLPSGRYEVTIALSGFATIVRSGITLALNQDAVVDVTMKAAAVSETITVEADSALLNTNNAEVGVRFDTKRIAELPVSNTRDVFSLALQAAGVSQTNTGQADFVSGPDFATNGMRTRSNNFMIDGQDSNDPSVTGRQQPINNTDTVSEIRLITNQFSAEYGRAAGSVMNVVTKNGTNAFHGSGFWYANRNDFNAMSNLDKAAGRTEAPFREDDQYGGTLGGPIVKDNTFFFAGYQRWTQNALGSGFTLNGAPTEAGRSVLQSAAGRPAADPVAAQVPARRRWLREERHVHARRPELHGAARLDHGLRRPGLHQRPVHRAPRPAPRLEAQPERALPAQRDRVGRHRPGDARRASPPSASATQQSAAVWLTSTLSNNVVNELRVGFSRLDTNTNSADPSSEEIPSLEINELGMVGFNAATNRTAIGLAVNLPQWRINDLWQVQDTFSYIRGDHTWKAGFDLRMIDVDSFFNPTLRGRLVYPTLQRYVDDVADVATINGPLPGGQTVVNYAWNDMYFFVQDEWRVRPTFTLNLGLRYELPGNWIDSLLDLNAQIVAAAGGDERYALSPGAEARHEQHPAAARLQLDAAHERRRLPRLPDRGRQAGGARRLRAHPRLRVPQHRPQHRELVPPGGHRHLPGAGGECLGALARLRLRAASTRSRSPARSCPRTSARPTPTSSASSCSARSRPTRSSGSATSGRAGTICSRRSTATRASPTRPCASTPLAASSASAATPPGPGTTRCR